MSASRGLGEVLISVCFDTKELCPSDWTRCSAVADDLGRISSVLMGVVGPTVHLARGELGGVNLSSDSTNEV